MAATLAANTTIKIGGTSTAMTTEACSVYAAGWSGYAAAYQITAASKRAIDPSVAVSVYVGGSLQSASAYAVDYAHGIIGFNSAPGGAVTITGAFLPLLTVAEAFSTSISYGRETAETGHYSDTGKRKALSVKTWEGSLEAFTGPRDVLDGGTLTFESMVGGGSKVFLEIDLGQTYKLRGWVNISKVALSVKHKEANTTSLDYVGVIQDATGRATDKALFSWA